MSISNVVAAHAFYYGGVGEGLRGGSSNLSYDGNDAFSYSTLVAKVIPARGRERADPHVSDSGLTLLPLDNVTRTTARHIALLRSASPFPVVLVPMEMGHHDLSPYDLGDGMLKELDRLSASLSRKREIERFSDIMLSLRQIKDAASDEWTKPLRDRRFRKYEAIVSSLESYAAEAKAKSRRKAAKANAEIKRIFSKADTAEKYISLLRRAFTIYDETSSEIRRKLTANGESYVWNDGDGVNVNTSQGITLGVLEVKAALHAWALGHDMRTWRVGPYAVVKYEGDVIQVGCHRIPRRNLEALYEVLFGKKLEIRKVA